MAHETVVFFLGGIAFEYDREKETQNLRKHGISFRSAARVFFDYDRIEFYDDSHSIDEDRYNTIGDTSAGLTVIGNIEDFAEDTQDILYVVYTERQSGRTIRLISARMATSFERGLYYGKQI